MTFDSVREDHGVVYLLESLILLDRYMYDI